MYKQDRLYYLDFIKFIAIFCVCYGHCIQHFLSGFPSENLVFRFIYSFHMPLFMAITGYFCYTDKSLSFYGVTKKKFRQLILPGICFAIVIPLLQGFPNGFDIVTTINSYWFLKSAFICAILYYSVKCFLPAKWLGWGILCTLILSQAIIYANVFRMYPAFLTGVLIHKYWRFIESQAKYITIISFSLFFLMFAFLTANFYGPQNLSSISGIFSTAFHLGYRIIIGSVATLGMICGTFLLDSHIRKNKGLRLLAFEGRYTLPIYILQTYFIELFLASFLNFDNAPSLLFYFVITPSICISVITISIFIAKVIEKSTITSFLFLGNQYKPIIKRSI